MGVCLHGLNGFSHPAWYFKAPHSYLTLQVEDMKEAMEAVLFQFGVDVIFAGHVHAYERTHPVFGTLLPTARWVPMSS